MLQDVAGTEIKKLWTSNTISLTCSLNFYPQLPASLISHKSHFYEVNFKIMTCSIAFLSRTAVHITSITSYYSLPCSDEAICIVKTFKFHSLKNIFIAIELCLYHCALWDLRKLKLLLLLKCLLECPRLEVKFWKAKSLQRLLCSTKPFFDLKIIII